MRLEVHFFYFRTSGFKMKLAPILFKYIRDMIKDTRNNIPKINKLIADILVESGLVKILQNQNQDHGFHNYLVTTVRKSFNRKNLNNMSLTIEFIDPHEALDTIFFRLQKNIVEEYLRGIFRMWSCWRSSRRTRRTWSTSH